MVEHTQPEIRHWHMPLGNTSLSMMPMIGHIPEKFAAQMLYALAQPDGISTTVGVRVNRDLRFGVKPNAGGMIMENLSSFLLKRSILTEVGGWDRTRMGADSELYERVKAKYGLASNKLFRGRHSLSYCSADYRSPNRRNRHHDSSVWCKAAIQGSLPILACNRACQVSALISHVARPTLSSSTDHAEAQ
jgi:hypothetical protein